MSAVASNPRQPKRWTEEEDEVLHQEAKKQSASGNIKDWHQIAEKLPGRSNKDCRKRWVNAVCGGLNKGFWNDSEDQRLMEALQKYGPKWVTIAEQVGTRRADQCAKRWQHGLDPKYKRGKWTADEDKLLLNAVKQHGREWKYIQRHHLPMRSKNDVKNRYTIMCKKNSSQCAADETRPSTAGGRNENGHHDDEADDDDDDDDNDDDDDYDEDGGSSSLGENHTPETDDGHSASLSDRSKRSSKPDQLVGDETKSSGTIDHFDFSGFVNDPSHYDTMGFGNMTADSMFQSFPKTAEPCPVNMTGTTTGHAYMDTKMLTSMFGSHIPAAPPPTMNNPPTSSYRGGETRGDEAGLIPMDSNILYPQRYSTLSSHQEDTEMQFGQEPIQERSGGSRVGGQMRIVVDIDDCPRDTLDYILDVTRPIKDCKVKVQIHMS